MRIDNERPINECLVSIIKTIAEARVPIPVSKFADEEEWGFPKDKAATHAVGE